MFYGKSFQRYINGFSVIMLSFLILKSDLSEMDQEILTFKLILISIYMVIVVIKHTMIGNQTTM